MLIVVSFVIYYRKNISVLFIPLIIIILVIANRSFPSDEYSVYQVVEAKDKYSIIQNRSSRFLLYYEGLDVGDIIGVRGESNDIKSASLFNTFDFTDFLATKRVWRYYDANNISYIKEPNSIRKRLLTRAKIISEDVYSILSRKNIDESTSFNLSLSYFLFSLKRRFRKHKMVLLITSVLIMLLFGNTISLTFFIVDTILNLYFETKIDARDRYGISLIAAMCLFPNSIHSFSFIVILVLRLLSLLYPMKRFQRYFVLMILYFVFHGQFDFLSIITYPILKSLELILYILAVFTLISKLLFPFELFLNIYRFTKSLSLTHYYVPSLLVICYWLVNIFKLLNSQGRCKVLTKVIVVSIIAPYLNPIASVEYINVGQGDSTLIVGPFQSYVIMIDAAGNRNKDIAQEILIPRLKQLGIRRIDTLVVTHDDFDHSGSVDTLRDNFKVNNVVISEEDNLDNSNFVLVNNLGEYESDNDNSLVVVGQHYGLNFFFAGDSGVDKEDLFSAIYNFPIDILKLSHHGSDTSSSNEFLHKSNAKVAIASSGINNRYNHPSDKVIERLDANAIYLFNTADNGSIRIDSFLFFHIVRTSKGEFGIIVNR